MLVLMSAKVVAATARQVCGPVTRGKATQQKANNLRSAPIYPRRYQNLLPAFGAGLHTSIEEITQLRLPTEGILVCGKLILKITTIINESPLISCQCENLD